MWDKPLQAIGEKGLFVKEIEEELLKGTIDIAVHSMKDLPTETAPGLTIAAVLTREDPRDAFVSPKMVQFGEIGEGSRLGTNSLRRKSQILSMKPGVTVVPIRGNIDTRIRKIEALALDGIILAMAGVKRMGFQDLVRDILPLDIMVPPSGQGAIGVETRQDRETVDFIAPLDDLSSRKEVTLERKLQSMIGGGCSIPLGINASIAGEDLVFSASYGDENGVSLVRARESGSLDDADTILLSVLRRITGSGNP